MNRREKLQNMLKNEPQDVFLNYALAMELVTEGDELAAAAQFDRVLALDPNYLGAYQQKASTLIRVGRLDQARDCLRDGLEVAKAARNQHAAEEMEALLSSLNT